MGLMDNIKSKADDELRGRFEQLKSMEQSGELDDKGREELNSLRQRFEHKNG